ncbi:transcriptional regulator [Clostridium carboxidivorans P7]|uniref:Transcriptional regulator, ArsR family n=1 Tax=Clostridium carboxidivorans P7 TaxID=536227 RepID=C6PZ15_9CLOT|nr:metalloregulator ArsR/SmtB family transcription factor [Clostridium carboxidivorans]AKN31408.1 transcriptional regulator [Clostridium carboxidivorans P7]EET85501.1 transcriptional regulator, ArsR family [Clostridium carboxidivorans P7]EFG87201.1 transcriptional regulator, ArsR family [Clostridium carboxidivorans P7]
MSKEEISVKIFKALGHPIRYKIVKFLYDGPKCVCKLNEDIEFSQANLSQHLRILKEAGILSSEKVGMNTHYRISGEEIKNIVDSVDKFVMSYFNDSK